MAAHVGVAPEVIDYLPGQGLLAIRYIEGFTYSAQQVELNLSRIAQSCKLLHSSQPFVRNFNMFSLQKAYLAIVEEKGFRLPENYVNFAGKMQEMNRALAVLQDGLVPCNNDLLPGNFIDDGRRVWIIDYEYSGNNDPCFELGNIWAESFLELDRLTELVDAYYGEHRPEKIARAWLFALAGKYGWTLWASIQNSVSDLEFDFWNWGMEKFTNAQREFSGSLFAKMLRQVTEK